MKIQIVTPHYSTRPGALERHVQRLAHGLARRGATVEVLTQEGERWRQPVVESDGVLVRRFLPPALWEHVRRRAATHDADVVHLHGAHVGLGLAVARAGVRRLVFTPHIPVEQLSRWPRAQMLRAVVDRAGLILSTSRGEADLLGHAVPSAASRVRVVPNGVDGEEIQAARPFRSVGQVVLAVGRLARYSGLARTIAAMASLDPELRLVVVGDGPARRSLQAHAVDLQVRSRVLFTGAVPDAVLYRWLRTAAVVVAPAERQGSGVQMLEAVSAGAPVVASATSTHREIAAYLESPAVVLVSPTGSPLEVADAISRVAGTRDRSTIQAEVPTWDAVVDRTLELYRQAAAAHPMPVPDRWNPPRPADPLNGDPRVALER
jgi:glycosyltransferase involved in cell wall biosynthesis